MDYRPIDSGERPRTMNQTFGNIHDVALVDNMLFSTQPEYGFGAQIMAVIGIIVLLMNDEFHTDRLNLPK